MERSPLLYKVTFVEYSRIIPTASRSQWNPVSVHWRTKGGNSLPYGDRESLYFDRTWLMTNGVKISDPRNPISAFVLCVWYVSFAGKDLLLFS
jgi:hypothetical protein